MMSIKQKVGIVDYGMGNLLSVRNAVETCGGDPQVITSPKALGGCDRVILPGVGAFGDCIRGLAEKGFSDALQEAVIVREKPILGICLGMQVMAKRGFEGGEYAGLGWLDAQVIRLRPSDQALRVPHVGWTEIHYRAESFLFRNLPAKPEFYFSHSYYMNCANSSIQIAFCDYGGEVTVAVQQGNIFATQFHPEKSQGHGLKVIENFLAWTGEEAR